MNSLARAMVDRIREELDLDPRIDATKISVAASYGGAVILGGSVHSYAEKCWAEDVARAIPGVTAVDNELDVRITIGDYRTDDMLQRIVSDVLDALCAMPDVRPAVEVREGWVTLSGTVEWPFQKQGAEESIKQIAGIRGIANNLRIMPRVSTPSRPGTLARP